MARKANGLVEVGLTDSTRSLGKPNTRLPMAVEGKRSEEVRQVEVTRKKKRYQRQ